MLSGTLNKKWQHFKGWSKIPLMAAKCSCDSHANSPCSVGNLAKDRCL